MVFSFDKEAFLKPSKQRDINPIMEPLENRFKTKKFSKPKTREFNWYSKESKKSIKLEELKFTNFLSEISSNGEAELRLDEIKNDINCLSVKPYFNVTGIESNARLKNIISNYVENDIDPEYTEFVYKINFTNSLGSTTAFRVFYLYEVDGLNNIHKHSVLFVDPHHLVISAPHKGKDKEQKLIENFEKAKNHKKDIETFLNRTRMFD